MADGRQLGRPLLQRAVERRPVPQGAHQVSRHRAFRRAVRGAKDHQAVGAQQLGEGSGERRRQIVPRPVVPPQPREDLGAELRVGGSVPHGVQHRADVAAERFPIERHQWCGGIALPEHQPRHLVVDGGQVNVVGFGEVVVVTPDPEDGHDGLRYSRFEKSGQGDRRECFVEREQRPGEESRLLARRHAERLLLEQSVDVGAGRVVRQKRGPERRVDRDGAGGREAGGVERRRCIEWRRLDRQRHDRSATRMVRGAPAASGPPS